MRKFAYSNPADELIMCILWEASYQEYCSRMLAKGIATPYARVVWFTFRTYGAKTLTPAGLVPTV